MSSPARSQATLMIAIAVLALCAIAAGAWTWMKDREQRALARVADEWQRLATCLVGDPATSDRAAVLRRAALGAASEPASEEAWPMRCSTHRDALASALPDVADELYPELRAVLAEPSVPWAPRATGLPPQVDHEALDRAWQAADAGDLPMTPAPDVEGPALAAPVSLRDVAALRAEELTTEDAPGADLRLLLSHEVCTVAAARPARIECSPLGSGLRGSGFRVTRLVDGEEGAGGLVVQVGSAIEAESGIFDALTGARIPEPPDTFDAALLAGGLVTLSLREKRVLVGRVNAPPEVLAGVDPVERGYAPSAPQLVSDALVWLARGRLFARSLADPAPHDLGAITIDALPMTTHACRAGDFLAIDLGGPGFAVRSGTGWSAPAIDPPLEPSGDARLSCDPQGVSAILATYDATGGGRDAALVEVRCRADGCTREEIALPGLGPLPTAPVAVRLGERVLLAFRRASPDGADAGVRIRLAPAAELASAPEIVVLDPMETEPTREAGTVVVRLQAYARSGHAWLLVFRDGEWLPIHVAPDGAFEAVRAASTADAP